MAFTITYENKSETFEKKVKLLDLTNNNKDYICALVNGQLRELDYDVYYDGASIILEQCILLMRHLQSLQIMR